MNPPIIFIIRPAIKDEIPTDFLDILIDRNVLAPNPTNLIAIEDNAAIDT
jgi:hypothetical protein